MDKLYLTSNNIPPHGLQLHDDRTSFDPATAGESQLWNNLSANSLFFLVFEPRQGEAGLSCRRIPFPIALYVTVLANACT